MAPRKINSTAIRTLNDAARISGPVKSASVRWLVTSGVQDLGPDFVQSAIRAVMSFGSFDRDNDPHDEHDFGSIDVETQRIFWKIDYYNRTLDGGSPDPSSEDVTCRVITIMLAEEY